MTAQRTLSPTQCVHLGLNAGSVATLPKSPTSSCEQGRPVPALLSQAKLAVGRRYWHEKFQAAALLVLTSFDEFRTTTLSSWSGGPTVREFVCFLPGMARFTDLQSQATCMPPNATMDAPPTWSHSTRTVPNASAARGAQAARPKASAPRNPPSLTMFATSATRLQNCKHRKPLPMSLCLAETCTPRGRAPSRTATSVVRGQSLLNAGESELQQHASLRIFRVPGRSMPTTCRTSERCAHVPTASIVHVPLCHKYLD